MTRLDVVKVVIQHPDTARPPARTVRVQHRKYVDGTADETEVLFYTAADAHASVAGVLNDNHLVEVTFDAQILGLAERVLHQHRRCVVCSTEHQHIYTSFLRLAQNKVQRSFSCSCRVRHTNAES